MSNLSIGVDYFSVPDLNACLTDAIDHNKYQFVVIPIVHPRFRRKAFSIPGFTRSDILLEPEKWSARIVGKLSPYIDVDSPDPIVSRRHEDLLVEELDYFQNLSLCVTQFTLSSRQPYNLVRILHNHIAKSHNRPQMWAKVTMQAANTGSECEEECLDSYDEPWRWWSRLHEMMDWCKQVGVVLEMTADLPPPNVIRRWLGEPVRAIFVPTHLFTNNKKGYPVLSRAHQEVLMQFANQDVQVIISGAHRSPIQHYHMYMHHLWEKRPAITQDAMHSFSKGWEDFLQTPLQPLSDNLDSYTYNVFEKDPVKYRQYQKAIVLALLELRRRDAEKDGVVPPVTSETKIVDGMGDAGADVNKKEAGVEKKEEADIEKKEETASSERVYRVMVLGAGRGPLVRAAFNAADITKTKIQMVVVEKNPCALVSLAAQAREVWPDRDLTLVSGDMRKAKDLQPANIIVSELLGSWGDNELSPECLDGAAHLLTPGGISIPSWYTSYIAPITSPTLWTASRAVPTTLDHDRYRKNLENFWVVYMKNVHLIADVKPVFTFKHPADSIDEHGAAVPYHDPQSQAAPDNRRAETLAWTAGQDGVMHGFSGYFDCELYGGEHISIEPETHSPGMISWFPVYIPIRTPLRFEKGEVIVATFWRCVNERKVWYEWIVRVGSRVTPLHNVGGRSYEMLL